MEFIINFHVVLTNRVSLISLKFLEKRDGCFLLDCNEIRKIPQYPKCFSSRVHYLKWGSDLLRYQIGQSKDLTMNYFLFIFSHPMI